MKEWFGKFMFAHGERLFFGGSALLFSVAFMWAGSVYDVPELKSTGVTVATGVVMLMFNKARGGTIEGTKDE